MKKKINRFYIEKFNDNFYESSTYIHIITEK